MDDDLIAVGTFIDPTDAELARARLASEGIEALVAESASFNPILSSVLGTELKVRGRDAAKARRVLAEHAAPAKASADDGEGEGVVRCPKCELAYCSFERPGLRSLAPGQTTVGALVALLLLPFKLFERRRWHCHKCEHVWDDPKEGPKAMTPSEPGDPRPVFRLRRTSAGMGVFIGLVTGGFLGLIVPGLPALVPLLGFAFVGFFIGSAIRSEVCSEPGCRAPLAPNDAECPRCKGSIAGSITRASAHYSASADFRRELAFACAKKRGKSSPKAKRNANPTK